MICMFFPEIFFYSQSGKLNFCVCVCVFFFFILLIRFCPAILISNSAISDCRNLYVSENRAGRILGVYTFIPTWPKLKLGFIISLVALAHSCGFIAKSECDRLQDNVITGGDVRTDMCVVPNAICMTLDDYKMRSRWKEADHNVFKKNCQSDVTLMEEQRCRVFVNGVLWRIFGR